MKLEPTPEIPISARNKALEDFAKDLAAMSELDCPECGLPHPSRNPYCFCRRAAPTDTSEG